MIAQFVTSKEYLMKKIAVASALMIFLSLINANAKGCSSSHVSGRCAVAQHPVKHANKKRPNMGGAFIGAYQR
jgi:hypothetical protein